MTCRAHLSVRAHDLTDALGLTPTESASVLSAVRSVVKAAIAEMRVPVNTLSIVQRLATNASVHTEGGQEVFCFDFGTPRSSRLRAVCWISPIDQCVYCLHILSGSRWAKPAVRAAGLAESRRRLGDVLTHYGLKP